MPRFALPALALIAAVAGSAAQAAPPALEGVPRYAHIFVIVEENKNYEQILDPAAAPNIAALAAANGNATAFYGEVHPSEGNYVALLGGDTFGIHDDDAWYCNAASHDPNCAQAGVQPGYPDHTVHAPHLGDQLVAHGLTWKGYYENLPAPGSLAYTASDPAFDDGSRKTALYASKHSGFVNFESAQKDPERAAHLVGFDQLHADLASGRAPSFALIVPNQCNEMHGLHGAGIPADCDGAAPAALIRRGDAMVGKLVAEIEDSAAWRARENAAIVITFDEGSGKTREGCCSVTPDATSNFGGGHIPTIVIVNHGVGAVRDATPYNHYALLRTIEDAFGVDQHLGRADDTKDGVRPMTSLFQVR